MEAKASLNVRDDYPLPHIMKDDLQRLREDPRDVVIFCQYQTLHAGFYSTFSPGIVDFPRYLRSSP